MFKTLTKWLCCLSAFFVLGCGSQVRLSVDELPHIPEGKARLIFIYDKDPLLWGLTPFALSVDHKVVLWVKILPEFSAVDIEAGTRALSNFKEAIESSERPEWQPLEKPLMVDFNPGETRYFFIFAGEVNDHGGWRHRFNPADVWLRPYRLLMREIGPIEASRLLRVTRVSG